MSFHLEFTERRASGYMDDILALFKPGAKITVVVRNPTVPGDTDFILTSDDLDEAVKAIHRQQRRHSKLASPT